MISILNVHVTFQKGTPLERHVLQGIDLNIPTGEFLTVIGSNGAGKSTLLNVIAGSCLPDQGSIILEGKDVTKLETYERSGYVARVFQDPLVGTCAELTIGENLAIAYHRGKRGLNRSLNFTLTPKERNIFKEALSYLNFGLEDRLDLPMGFLSGGQRQALSLLMATLTPSSILLLDEHTAALDPKTAATMMDLSEHLIQQKKLTTLMVTHSLSQALQHGTRTVMLHAGKIVLDIQGEARASLKPEDLLKRFGQGADSDRLLL